MATLHGQRRPDLRPTRITGPTATTIGSSINVTAGFTNRGTAAAPANWTALVVLSRDAVITPFDVRIGSRRITFSLPVDQVIEASVPVTIPAGLVPGVYYYGLVLDATGTVVESNEQNNRMASVRTVTVGGPDLVPTAVSGPTSLDAGQQVSLSFTVRNQGQTRARTGCPLFDPSALEELITGEEVPSTPCGWIARFFLSLDADISAMDFLVGEFNVRRDLASNESRSYSPQVVVPLDAPSGPYYLGVIVDATGTVRELEERNNILATAGTIPVAGHPDLIPEWMYTGVPRVGVPLTVGLTARNQGALPVPAGWQGGFSLSKVISSGGPFPNTTAITVPLGTYTETNTIAAGARLPTAQQVVIPPTYTNSSGISIPVAGNWHLKVRLDQQGTVVEGNETNNRDSVALTIEPPPDLVPYIIEGPPAADLGSQVTLTIQVRNNGWGFAPNGWTAAIYLVGTAGPTLVERFTETAIVGALGSLVSTRTLSLPASVTPGNYTWRFIADEGNAVFELNATNDAESNNALDGATIQIAPTVDLVPTTISGPGTVIHGGVIPVTWSVANQGAGSDPASWTARIVLSTDNVIDAGDVTLGDIPLTTVAGGAAASGTTSFQVTATPATYYIGLIADAAASVSERDETNNGLVSGATIVVLPPPDLVPTAINAPNQVQAGNAVTVTVSVANQGPGSAPAGWVRRIYLSDPANAAADVLLGTFTDPTPVGPGTSVNVQDIVTVPAATARNDYDLVVILAPPYPETNTANNTLRSTARLRVR